MLLVWLLVAAQTVGVEPQLANYLVTAEQYRGSGRADTVATVGRWPRRDVKASVTKLLGERHRLRSVATELGQIELAVVEAAAMMHVEAGLRAYQVADAGSGKLHLDAAAELVDWYHEEARRRRDDAERIAVEPTWRLEPRIGRRDLYLVLGRGLLAMGLFSHAERFSRVAPRVAPDDAEALEVHGIVSESLALEHGARGRDRKARGSRRKAERLYRAALDLDAGRLEARLRLARLLLEDGPSSEAEGLLEPLVRVAPQGRQPQPRQRYLALLFLGRGHARRGRGDEAAACYQRAIDTWPDTQAARLALAQALEGLSEVRPRGLVADTLVASMRADRVPDPWWLYPFGDTAVGRVRLTELKAAVVGR